MHTAASTFEHVQALAPKVGDTFHTRDLCARMDAMSPTDLFPLLQELKELRVVRFTGKTCVFERVG